MIERTWCTNDFYYRVDKIGIFDRVFPMSQDHIAILQSTESKHRRYDNRNKKRVENKLELKKYDPTLKKHVVYKEVKK
jgi:large subunit ribosomal protein L33